MRWFWAVLERTRVLFRRGQFESDMDEEIRSHLEELIRRNIGRGMSEAEATRAARRSLGSVEATKEEVRSSTGVRLVQDFLYDVRHASRNLRKRPGFTLALLLTVALCIGSNGAVFNVVYTILLRPLPFNDSDRIVRIYNSYPAADVERSGTSVPDYYDRRERMESLEEVALYTEIAHTLGGEDGSQHVFSMEVTPSFFHVFGVRPLLGGLFPETIPRGTTDIVIGFDLWSTTFGSSPDVVGTSVIVEGRPHTIIGVLPESFRFSSWNAQLYVPLVFSPESRSDENRHSDNFQMAAKLASGATVEFAQQELDVLNQNLVESYPPPLRATVLNAGYRAVVDSYLGDLTNSVRRPLILLGVGALLVLAAGIANITTLFLIRTTSRRREIGYRLALGASRGRVLRQLLVESVLVALIGGLVGVMIARWSLGFLDAFAVYEIPRVEGVSLSAVVVSISILVAVLIGTVAAIVPAKGLLFGQHTGLASSNRSSMSERTSRIHRGLVGAQVAFALILVVNTGLLVETLRNLTAIDPGFEADRVVVGATSLPSIRYPDAAAGVRFTEDLVRSIMAVPGAEAAAVASHLPFSGSESQGPMTTEQALVQETEAVGVIYRTSISAGYFDVMGMELLDGRNFNGSDTELSRRVAVIDRALALRYWGDESPVGERFWNGSEIGSAEESIEIIGVVESIRQNDLTGTQLTGAAYFPFAQRTNSFFRIATRFSPEVVGGSGLVRERVSALDPDLLYYRNDTMESSVGASLLLRRLPMRLLIVFASVGLFLVMLGIYGVTAYAVGRRTSEIGLRMALGGTGSGIAALLAKEWASVLAIGLGVGVLGAVASRQLTASLLYGTSVIDLRVIAGAMVLVVVSAAASFSLPVRRAVHIDPASTLGAD